MAILHHKETKIQAVLGRLPKSYTHEQFVEMFIKLYSKDWGKIKSAYIKQSQDREAGTVINMPKPDLYLKQLLEIHLDANPSQPETVASDKTETIEPVVAKTKQSAKQKTDDVDETKEITKKPKTVAKRKVATEDKVEPIAKIKTPAKKKLANEETAKPVEVEKKVKGPTKKATNVTESVELTQKVKAPAKKKVAEEKPEKKTSTKE